jgi:hypothetical protein
MNSNDFIDWLMTAALAVLVILGMVALTVEVFKAIF